VDFTLSEHLGGSIRRCWTNRSGCSYADWRAGRYTTFFGRNGSFIALFVRWWAAQRGYTFTAINPGEARFDRRDGDVVERWCASMQALVEGGYLRDEERAGRKASSTRE
jgi:hypothetical protein